MIGITGRVHRILNLGLWILHGDIFCIYLWHVCAAYGMEGSINKNL